MTFRKYLVLAGVTVFAAAGDSMLSHGMKQVGNISFHNIGSLLLAVTNLWVAIGILLLLAFFASYMSALSWADLTYVLPASSLGYVLLALVARFALHEQVSSLRWAGIALISGGVGFVAGGPSVTHHPDMGSSSSSAHPGAASGTAGGPPNQQQVRVTTGGKP
ncbi:MAG TPA: EamA family transporter [Candidatus Sulfotelmatobacter sp.]